MDIRGKKMTLQTSNNDYYEGFSEDTSERLKRIQEYVNLALKNGDAAYQEKPGELIIKIRLKKKDKP